MENKFDLLLPSNVVSEKSGHDNTIGCYTTILPKPLVFDSHDWVVGLRSISYTYSWFNIKKGDYIYLYPAGAGYSRQQRNDLSGDEFLNITPPIGRLIPLHPGRYDSPEKVVEQIEERVKQQSDSRIEKLPSLEVEKGSNRLIVKVGKMKDGTSLLIRFSKDLAAMLGYETSSVVKNHEYLSIATQQRGRRETSLKFHHPNLPFCDRINKNREEQIKLIKFKGTCNLRPEEEIPKEEEEEIEHKNENQPITTDQQQTLPPVDGLETTSQQNQSIQPTGQDNTDAGKQQTQVHETSATDQNRQDKETEKLIDTHPDTLPLSQPISSPTEGGDTTTKKFKPNPEQATNYENVSTNSSSEVSEKQTIDFSVLPAPEPLVSNLGAQTPVFLGDRPIDMNRGIYNMMVYSNVGDYMTVGDTRCQLLQSVEIPSKVKIGDQLVKRYDNPDYVPLHSLFIPSIEIEIKDDAGKPLEFEFGRVTVRLQFKKKEHLHSDYYGELLP